MTQETFRRLFEYDAWGNLQVIESLRLATLAPSSRACAVTAHLIGAGRVWFERLHGRVSAIEVWPNFSVDECETAFRELDQSWKGYLRGLKPGDLERPIAYVNTKGEKWGSQVGDILMHVVLHGSYHRGQIAMLVRGSGARPAYTDYIEARRRGVVA